MHILCIFFSQNSECINLFRQSKCRVINMAFSAIYFAGTRIFYANHIRKWLFEVELNISSPKIFPVLCSLCKNSIKRGSDENPLKRNLMGIFKILITAGFRMHTCHTSIFFQNKVCPINFLDWFVLITKHPLADLSRRFFVVFINHFYFLIVYHLNSVLLSTYLYF